MRILTALFAALIFSACAGPQSNQNNLLPPTHVAQPAVDCGAGERCTLP